MPFIDFLFDCMINSITSCFYFCCCRHVEVRPLIDQPGKTLEEVDKKEREALVKYRDEKKQASTKVSKRKTLAEEREVIINKIPDVPTVSLSYLSNMTLIPQERIKEILQDDSDYLIEEPFVINKKILTEEQIIKISGSIKTQITKEEDELSPIYKLCFESQSLYKQGSEFCSNCGARLKDN